MTKTKGTTMVFMSKDLDDEQSFDIPDDSVHSERQEEANVVHTEDDSGVMPDEGEDNSITEDNIDNIYYALLAGIGLVFVYFIYKVYSFMVPLDEKPLVAVDKKIEAPQKMPERAIPAPKLEEKPSATESVQKSRPATTIETRIVKKTSNKETIAKLEQIAQKLDRQAQTIAELKSDNDYLVRLLDAQKLQLKKSTERVSAIATQITTLHTLRKQQVEDKQPKKDQPVAEVWTIRAMIDGRAWIQSSKGQTMTVAIGSEIKGYGVVEAIIVGNGTIITSSGKIIVFKRS
tara:strand:- start:3237 stop:4103 length:867 start_codon:yes stop_codon:yes gene_type:complete